MKTWNLAAQASVLALALVLAGCGDSGGVASTPTPTPTPAATYTKLADMTGDRTFQTGGIHWQNSTAGITGQGQDSFGSGVVVAYNAAADSYTVTPPGGASVTFLPSEATVNGPTVSYTKAGVASPPTFRLSVPSVGGVQLSYLVLGTFGDSQGANSKFWTAVGGAPTIASDMPKSGSASYTAEAGANILTPGGTFSANSTTGTTATFSANFASGAITSSLHLIGALNAASAPQDFGTFNGTGAIASGGPGFAGTFAGTTGAGFSGAFFGPQALEMAYDFNFISGATQVFGAAYGRKQ